MSKSSSSGSGGDGFGIILGCCRRRALLDLAGLERHGVRCPPCQTRSFRLEQNTNIQTRKRCRRGKRRGRKMSRANLRGSLRSIAMSGARCRAGNSQSGNSLPPRSQQKSAIDMAPLAHRPAIWPNKPKAVRPQWTPFWPNEPDALRVPRHDLAERTQRVPCRRPAIWPNEPKVVPPSGRRFGQTNPTCSRCRGTIWLNEPDARQFGQTNPRRCRPVAAILAKRTRRRAGAR
jgi:hypothetical protein